MIIDAYTFCWNEEIRIKYFLNLWSPICRNITIFDNGSDDDSQKIASEYGNVTWDTETVGNKFDDKVKSIVSNQCWIDSSSDADLIYIGDIDEILYHPLGLRTYYESRLQEGYNVFKPYAYDMVNINLPKHRGQFYEHEDFKFGHRICEPRKKIFNQYNPAGSDVIDPYTYDKCSVFSPKNLDKVWYSTGFHKSVFTGPDVKVCRDENYKMLHYKYIGREWFVKYNIAAGKRVNKKHGIGSTYQLTTEGELYDKFDMKLSKPNKKII